MKVKKFNKKSIIISSICFIFFVVILFYIFMDGVGGFSADGVSGFIEQANLRKSLSSWYQLIFYTFQINLLFCISGMLYVFIDKQIIKNLMFCFSSFLIFCLFAMVVFDFSSYKTNAYESSKTTFMHLIIPVTSLFIIFWIRKEIILNTKILIACSFYMTFYLILSLIVYYNVNFADNVDGDLAGKRLWIYRFLDYDNQILFVPTTVLWFRIISIGFWLFLSPVISFALFLIPKFAFNIKIDVFVESELFIDNSQSSSENNLKYQ